jgi:hypothetical protein
MYRYSHRSMAPSLRGRIMTEGFKGSRPRSEQVQRLRPYIPAQVRPHHRLVKGMGAHSPIWISYTPAMGPSMGHREFE